MAIACIVVCLGFIEPVLPPLRDGDRVAFIGDGWLEREQRFGHLETALLVRQPHVRATFRNLAWSGDTTRGLSRGYFDGPDEAAKRLREQLIEARPTVVVCGYGMAESFRGQPGGDAADPDRKTLRSGLDELAAAVPAARWVVVAPLSQEPIRQTSTELEGRRRSLTEVSAALADWSKAHKAEWVDLLTWSAERSGPPLTDNGLHPTDDGWRRLAAALAGPIPRSPPAGTIEKIRQEVVRKNRLWFLRYRPHNITYLTGFRKHEQGKNAKELDDLGREAEAAERRIAALLAESSK